MKILKDVGPGVLCWYPDNYERKSILMRFAIGGPYLSFRDLMFYQNGDNYMSNFAYAAVVPVAPGTVIPWDGYRVDSLAARERPA